jgi:uncharacterized caspase-like protein
VLGEEGVGGLAFSPDGATLVSRHSRRREIKLWNAATGAPIATVPLRAAVTDISVNRNGVILAQTSAVEDLVPQQEPSSVTRLISPKGAAIGSVQGFADGNVLAVDSTGQFDGPSTAWLDINWRFGANDVAPVEAFFSEYFDPGLLGDILAGRSVAAPTALADKDRRQPDIRIATDAMSADDRRRAHVKLEVSEAPSDAEHPAGSGVRDVRLFRNGSLVKIWHDAVALQAGRASLETTVNLARGSNVLTAYAFNSDNVKSLDASVLVDGPAQLDRKGTPYVVAIGIDEYAASGLTLRYAVADARAFGEEVAKAQKNLGTFDDAALRIITNGEATKANIAAAIGDIAGRAGPEDTVIVYFAGHGIAHGDRFYLVAQDIPSAPGRPDRVVMEDVVSHGISDRDLTQLFETIDAGRLLLVIDACQSGQALESDEKRRGPMNSKGFAQLAYEKGMHILTATQTDQFAREPESLGHGLLTYALVEEGLRQHLSDDDPKDGRILVREWLKFATARVPILQNETAQRERGVTLDEPSTSDPARSAVQRPRVFWRREPESEPFVIAKDGSL